MNTKIIARNLKKTNKEDKRKSKREECYEYTTHRTHYKEEQVKNYNQQRKSVIHYDELPKQV